jgi:hypothetical protein
MIGRVVPHYKILDKLGEGGIGDFVEAEDMKLTPTVVLKFHPEIEYPRARTRCLFQEIRLPFQSHLHEVSDAYLRSTLGDRVDAGFGTFRRIRPGSFL